MKKYVVQFVVTDKKDQHHRKNARHAVHRRQSSVSIQARV